MNKKPFDDFAEGLLSKSWGERIRTADLNPIRPICDAKQNWHYLWHKTGTLHVNLANLA
jgi:hypothetical protein